MFVVSRSRSVRVSSLAALTFVLATCSGDKPTDSTPPDTQPPAPAATATTAPAAATPLPGMSCNLPAVTVEATHCPREGSANHGHAVDAAIQRAMSQRPDIFSGNQILDIPLYRVLVHDNLKAAGYCVQWDADREGHREIMVKDVNTYSEHYTISASNGTVRSGFGAYRATCYPANFPVNPQPLGQRGDCAMPSSREYGCDRTGGAKFAGLMDEVVAQIEKNRTDLVRDGWMVGSWDAYHEQIIAGFKSRGYCAIWDGKEIAIKNNNDFSEQYQAQYSWGQLRRGDQAWRSTCKPAAF
jgi:hypothetical protein